MKKILFLDSYYKSFLDSLSVADTETAFHEYQNRLEISRFGTGSAYASEFRKLGWDAHLIVPNYLEMQVAWRKSFGLTRHVSAGWQLGPYISRLPAVEKFALALPHLHRTVFQQVRQMQPDVLYVQDLNIVSPSLLQELRRHAGIVVGEIASPLPPQRMLTGYQLIVSALIPLVGELRSRGIASEWNALGFDRRNWDDFKKLKARKRDKDITFIGSITRLQPSTLPLLKAISDREFNLNVYGPSLTKSALEKARIAHIYKGSAWGAEMFEILGTSKIVINRHGDIAQGFATNMRMFEATGMGALLLNDAKLGLQNLFVPEKEIVLYDNPQHACNVMEELLSDEERLAEIAMAGQARTMQSHTYENRTKNLIAILESVLSRI